ncbi:MAG: metal-dependent transcriptional regulator [Clostridia bacterium]|nr:metal-dependent transcriptional regulator [Clostridia bacterium]
MALQESGEMYLETIYVLSKKSNHVHAINVCEELGYSKPSVSRAVGILKKDGYITVDADSHIILTEKGAAVAEPIYQRHTILSRFIEALGVDAETAARDACKIEHVISTKTFDAIKRALSEEN